MDKKSQVQLWRVEWVHKSGYQAPSKYVEAEKKREAINLAKSESRLSDFPESWSCHAYSLGEVKKIKGSKRILVNN